MVASLEKNPVQLLIKWTGHRGAAGGSFCVPGLCTRVPELFVLDAALYSISAMTLHGHLPSDSYECTFVAVLADKILLHHPFSLADEDTKDLGLALSSCMRYSVMQL